MYTHMQQRKYFVACCSVVHVTCLQEGKHVGFWVTQKFLGSLDYLGFDSNHWIPRNGADQGHTNFIHVGGANCQVENMATLQFTVVGSGGMLPQEIFDVLRHILVHSEAYREAHRAS